VRKLKSLLLAISLLVLVAPLSAQTKGIATFGGLKNLEFVNDFYNGGKGSLGSGPGKDLQLQFASNAQAIVSASKGGSGNVINNPGAYPVMFFQTGKDVVMTATAGVSVGLWFSYSALQPGTATVYDGPNGAGNILASITLSPNNSGCNTYKMCVWSPVGVPLTTPAGSIRFSGAANFLAIGAIHLGVKLPTSTVLTSSQNPSVQGQSVTFTAAVSATGAVPVGTVRFKTGNVIVGEIPVVSGTASITLSNLPIGPTKISAIFRGTRFVTSTATLIQTVN
jgi:Bacterial Ig-like domain (group 3)